MPVPLDVDALLDEALDELDDDDDSCNSEQQQQHLPAAGSSVAQECLTVETVTEESPDTKEIAQDMMNSPNAPPSGDFQAMLRAFIRADDKDDDEEDQKLGQFMNQVAPKIPETKQKENVRSSFEETIQAILEDMAKANIQAPSTSTLPTSTDADLNENDFVKGLLENLGSGLENPSSENFNADAVIDGMMEQLLSKELMYEPMKQVTEKFPKWLDDNHSTVSPEEYKKRSQQFECFQKLVHVYETDASNVTELLELMQQVQEYGQPPQEIINEIAPGLELGEDGTPKLNPLQGMPFGEEECTIQ